jgi:hypothetical protein
MMRRVGGVAVSDLSVVRCLFVITALVVLCGLFMMLRRSFVVGSGVCMMLACFR